MLKKEKLYVLDVVEVILFVPQLKEKMEQEEKVGNVGILCSMGLKENLNVGK